MYTTSTISDPPPKRRLDWIDNLRVALIVLVVAHHAAQSFGPADWWYVPGEPKAGFLSAFSAFNGTFFMGLFFFVSAYFVPASLARRGGWRFIAERLKRLGIPLLVGAVTIIPSLMYLHYVGYRGYGPITPHRYFMDVYLGLGAEPADWTGPAWPDLQFGHLWFLQHLLVYCALYALCCALFPVLRRDVPSTPRLSSSRRWITGSVLLVIGVAVATFLVRIRYPLDTWVAALDFFQVEPARLPQYAVCFVLGVAARRLDWLNRISTVVGVAGLGLATVLAVPLFVLGPEASYFAPGGVNVESALWTMYETTLGTAMSVGLLVAFRERVTGGGRFGREMAAASFGVYILHVPVVVALQSSIVPLAWSPLLSWTTVTVAAIPLTFALATALRRAPGFRAVL